MRDDSEGEAQAASKTFMLKKKTKNDKALSWDSFSCEAAGRGVVENVVWIAQGQEKSNCYHEFLPSTIPQTVTEMTNMEGIKQYSQEQSFRFGLRKVPQNAQNL